ncbi:MAG: DMT family transporter [Clostridiales Family XIII bacterium]|jgi:drug/metabolite transporter (DMT)-like permease|nr:DMT family transporter [Clostridiales Family XIII bacterium]
MSLLVFSWGFEFIAAKSVLDVVSPITLVFFKYLGAFVILCAIRLIRTGRFPLRKRDIPFYFLCALFGEILYYVGEYGAMYYLPVSIVTILLAFVPAFSILIEWALFKRRPSFKVVLGILVCIIGVALVVGGDLSQLFGRGILGYLLAFMALVAWNIYNFITARLTKNYTAFDLTLVQLAASALVSMPYALFHLPPLSAVDGGFLFAVAYLAVISSCIGFVIYVNALGVIGVTPATLFSNMMPVTATFFGWLFLGETILPVQVVGGIIVVVAGSVVIYWRGKEDRSYGGIRPE